MRWRRYSIDSLQLILWDRQRITVDSAHAIAFYATLNSALTLLLLLLCLIVIFDQKFQIFLKQVRSAMYISLALVVWMLSSGVAYNTDSTTTTTTAVLLRHFVAMIQTGMRETIRILECIFELMPNL
jgi:hypothetical protein